MKVVLLFPSFYSLKSLFENAFKAKGVDVVSTDFRDFYPNWKQKVQGLLNSLPGKAPATLHSLYLKDINNRYISFIKTEKPDYVLLYNNGNLLPQAIDEITKICPVYNYLGDYPLFLDSRFALQTMMKCNHIFCPDTYWVDKLKKMGKENVSYLIVGYDKNINHPINFAEKAKGDYSYSSDLLFVGRGYKHSSYGYKRALFYNSFTNLDIRIYGREWEYWFEYFPKLKEKYHPIDKYLTFEYINQLCNNSKIYPIDLNPGLINGLHIRIFDAIGSGILPLVEYSRDIDIVFHGINLPIIKNYREASEIAKHYLNREDERIALITKLKNYVDFNYSADIAVNKIIDVFNRQIH